ncbi:hypothetical protein AVEN_225204-1 [Araneus ventricosus]|uniref:Uncharacterized protein n=1 Tax=Araneus ventricosus TaxID=182803 RepID=A0A4Y2AL68_ARAVE|nr:hypothetical protein AVEN_225204-1 [Araneus ventricosus]
MRRRPSALRLVRRPSAHPWSPESTGMDGAAGAVRKLGEEVPAGVPSPSFDRGSKLRGLSQNSPRVASKRDINIIKLQQRGFIDNFMKPVILKLRFEN